MDEHTLLFERFHSNIILEILMELKNVLNRSYVHSMLINHWTTFSKKSTRISARNHDLLRRIHHVLSFSVLLVVDEKLLPCKSHANMIYLLVRRDDKEKHPMGIRLFVLVSIPTLIKQQIASNTSIGMSMKAYVTRQSMGKKRDVIIIEINYLEYFCFFVVM